MFLIRIKFLYLKIHGCLYSVGGGSFARNLGKKFEKPLNQIDSKTFFKCVKPTSQIMRSD